MNTVHLSPEQRKLCIEFAKLESRPDFEVYEEFWERIEAISPSGKLKRDNIPNIIEGYESGDIKLLPKFDALVDLPAGWAVTSRHDSGGNYGFESAGIAVLRRIWNCWRTNYKQRLKVINSNGKPVDVRG